MFEGICSDWKKYRTVKNIINEINMEKTILWLMFEKWSTFNWTELMLKKVRKFWDYKEQLDENKQLYEEDNFRLQFEIDMR